MLGRVLLVRLFLEHISFNVDYRVGSSADDARPRVDVQRYPVVHIDEMPRHNFRGSPHTCNKQGKDAPLVLGWQMADVVFSNVMGGSFPGFLQVELRLFRYWRQNTRKLNIYKLLKLYYENLK